MLRILSFRAVFSRNPILSTISIRSAKTLIGGISSRIDLSDGSVIADPSNGRFQRLSTRFGSGARCPRNIGNGSNPGNPRIPAGNTISGMRRQSGNSVSSTSGYIGRRRVLESNPISRDMRFSIVWEAYTPIPTLNVFRHSTTSRIAAHFSSGLSSATLRA